MKTKFALIAFAFLLFVSLSFSYTNVGGTCYCNSCSDCSNAFGDVACSTITPVVDISSALQCISATTSGVSKIIDCEGRTVSAYSVFGIPTVFAIKIDNVGGNVELRDCKLVSDGTGARFRFLSSLKIENINSTGSYASAINPALRIDNITSSVYVNNITSYGFLTNARISDSNNILVSNFSGSTIFIRNGKNAEVRDGFVYIPTAVEIDDFSNFTITNILSINGTVQGILIRDSANGRIHNITMYYAQTYGIEVDSLNDSEFYDLNIYNSNWSGLRIDTSRNIVVRDSYFKGNLYGGVYAKNSDNVEIYDITAVSNEVGGVVINSPNSIVRDVVAYSHSGVNNSGIVVGSNVSNTEIYNILAENNTVGVTFFNSKGSLVRDSTFKNNQIGVVFSLSQGSNVFRNNKVIYSSLAGIELASISNPTPPDLVYNNLFNNSLNADWNITVYPVYWNISKTFGANIIGGPYKGGNVWATPSGSGFSDVCSDVDKDGICDSSYTINGIGNIDYYPLAVGNYLIYAKGNIFFVDPTPPNDTILYNRDYLEVNATTNLTENYTKIVLHLYNYTSYYSSYTCDSPPIKPCYYNFTSLPSDVYYILAELYMINFTVYQSEVRVIALTNTSLYCTP